MEAGKGDKVAFHWRGEEGEEREITYADLHRDVQRFANALKDRGIGKGDVVGIYLPMVPELAVAMLACARIGAPHNVVFGGFSPGRGQGADGVLRREGAGDRSTARAARARRRRSSSRWTRRSATSSRSRRSSSSGTPARTARCRRAATSGSTRRSRPPTTSASPSRSTPSTRCSCSTRRARRRSRRASFTRPAATCSASRFTHRYVFDLKPDSDVFWCAADVGWVTGHSYIVYGPLSNGATSVMYEGAPDYPDKDIWWAIVERYGVTILYTAPTAIRACMKWGAEYPGKHDLSSLRLLGTRRRADQPEGMALVPQGDRRRALPDRRHVVADGDRAHPDQPAARGHRDQARIGDASRCRGSTPRWSTSRATRSRTAARGCWSCAGRGRGCCARSTRRTTGSWRPTTAVRRHDLPRRRRRPQGRGRLPLDPGPGRRRDQRLRASLSTAEIESAIVSHRQGGAEDVTVSSASPSRARRRLPMLSTE